MKKFLIGITITLVIGAGLWFYFYKYQPKTAQIWEAVPDDAVAVIELKKVDSWWYDNEENLTLKRLIQSELTDGLTNLIAESDSILKTKGYSFFDITGDKTLLLIVAKAGKKVVPALIIPESKKDNQFIQSLLEGFKTKYIKAEIAFSEYEGVLYTVISRKEEKLYLSLLNGLYVISPSEVAFKQIVKNLASDTRKMTVLAKKKMHEAKEVSTESMSMYINPVLLVQSMKPYMKDTGKSFLGALEHFADNAFLDVKFDDEAIYLNGFIHDSDTAFTFANCLKSQPPIPFSINTILPMRTISYAYVGIGDGQLFKQSLEQYAYSSSKVILENWEVLKKTYQIDVDEVFQSIKGEVVLVEVLNRLKTIDKLVYIKPKDVEKGSALFEKISKNILEQDQTLKREEYKDVEITYLGELDLPGMVFGEYFSGFEETYYAAIGDYIVVASTEQPIKALINDLEDDEVWSRSLEKNYLVERYFADANFGYYVDLSQSMTWLERNLSAEGSKSLQKYKPFLKQIGMLSLQVSNEHEQLFTSVTSVFEGAIPEDKKTSTKPIEKQSQLVKSTNGKVLFELFLDAPIIDKPTIVLNHVDKTREVLLLDSNFKLSLMAYNGELLWTYALDGPIVSAIEQVDVYRNQKLQYLFATKTKVYCIDRKGNNVENYPYAVNYGEGELNTLSVIDYDGSKNYRIMVSKTDGTVVLYDILGTDLEGWNPKKFDTKLAQPGKHVRVRGKDFILIAEQNKLHALTRRGDEYSGFPIALSGNITSDWFVSVGPSLRKSTVSIVVDNQDVQVFNFNGKAEKLIDFKTVAEQPKTQLAKSTGDEQKVYLIHAFGNVWQVLNDAKKELLTVELPYSDLELQYYPVAGKEVFVLVSKEADKVLLYNKKGKLIGGEALDGAHPIALLYSSSTNKFRVYLVNRKSLRMLDIEASY